VKDMDALGFRPREVLLELLTIYNNLAAAAAPPGSGGGEEDPLAMSIVRDERSFHLENFTEAAAQVQVRSWRGIDSPPDGCRCIAVVRTRLPQRGRRSANAAACADARMAAVPSFVTATQIGRLA
jgi:hypothetical protein